MSNLLRVFLTICFIGFGHMMFGQAEKFNLSFQNGEVESDNSFCVDLVLSFDQSGKLGSSNLVFQYDTEILTNPRLAENYLQASQDYLSPSISEPVKGRVSFNLELTNPDFGEDIEAAPNKTLISRVCFDRVDQDRLWGLRWLVDGTAATVVFVNDEDTQLEPENMANKPIIGNPVDFISFEVVQEGRDAKLTWETAEDSQDSKFEIERSFDEVLFAKVGEVDGQDIAGRENTYEFYDKEILQEEPQTFYYRIKQIELDGTPLYSQILSLTMEPEAFLLLEASPNPFRDKLIISYEHSLDQTVQLRVVSSLGKVLFNGIYEEQEGEIEVDTSSYPGGFYYVSAESHDGLLKKVEKVIKTY